MCRGRRGARTGRRTRAARAPMLRGWRASLMSGAVAGWPGPRHGVTGGVRLAGVWAQQAHRTLRARPGEPCVPSVRTVCHAGAEPAASARAACDCALGLLQARFRAGEP
ncbi:hypothetical protein PUN4_1150036 [Paraburkholderia unamae]|nr:hypothetical protein PUN4_1150036 [Paraburkholderia unamae]